MWHIAIPAWGPRCVDLALRVALPSMAAALREVAGPAQFIVHTDQPDLFADAFGDYAHDVRRIEPLGAPHTQFAACHAEVLAQAMPGDFVALLNADHIVSRETFAAAERRFAEGHNMVVCGSMRSCETPDLPPAGSSAGVVTDYTLDHPHSIASDSTWPNTMTVWPSVLYFRSGDSAVTHSFHLHPFAVVARPGLAFQGTIDRDLVDCFSEDEIHVVTDRDEMAIGEISPTDRAFYCRSQPHDAASIAEWARAKTSPRHRWFFKHRIAMRGDPAAAGADEPVDEVNRLLSGD